MAGEEQKLTDQRGRLAALQREVKMKELQLLDATRRKFLTYQQQQKESQLNRLDDEIKRKAVMRDTETQAAVEDADIRGMELEVQRKLFEQELHREFVHKDIEQNQELEGRRQQRELEERVQRGVQQAESQQQQNLRKSMQQSLARAELLQSDAEMRSELEARFMQDEVDREAKAVQLAHVSNENRRLERSIHSLMKDVQIRKEVDTEAALDQQETHQSVAADAETRRLLLLTEEAGQARQHVTSIQNTQEDMFERLRDLRQHLKRNSDVPAAADNCLNHSGDTEISTQFSLDRGRGQLETEERDLMADVRKLRSKLAQDGRNTRPPPNYTADLPLPN